jgi:hypothetical protein
MQIIECFFAALWGFVMQLAGLVLCLCIILQALRSLLGGSRR